MMNFDKPFFGDSGEFYLPETGRYFTFRPTENSWARHHELIHEIDVLDGVRFAIVRKGLAYVAIDEDSNGYPVLERWNITKRKTYVSS
jgi:hypothetical protein